MSVNVMFDESLCSINICFKKYRQHHKKVVMLYLNSTYWWRCESLGLTDSQFPQIYKYTTSRLCDVCDALSCMFTCLNMRKWSQFIDRRMMKYVFKNLVFFVMVFFFLWFLIIFILCIIYILIVGTDFFYCIGSFW